MDFSKFFSFANEIERLRKNVFNTVETSEWGSTKKFNPSDIETIRINEIVSNNNVLNFIEIMIPF